jgi:hypothetical protein
MTSNLPEKPEPVPPSVSAENASSVPTSTTLELWQSLRQQLSSLWQKEWNVTPVIVGLVLAVPVLLVLSNVLGFLNALPLIPDLLELIGLIYLLWFGYRYLLFADTRQELLKTIEGVKKKILG